VEQLAPHGPDEGALDRLLKNLRYVGGDYRARETHEQLAGELGGAKHPLAYLAVPPSVFEDVIGGLAESGLNRGGKIIIEKPFGRDLASAKSLNACVLSAFDDSAVFHTDHFVGKESALDLMVFRFCNVIL